MRGDNDQKDSSARYYKFAWNNLDSIPSIGQNDYQPKNGAFRVCAEGTFVGEKLEAFPAMKVKKLLPGAGRCIYCNRDRDDIGSPITLSSEHVIPEFLGAGIELPEASCSSCQRLTSEVESSIAKEMFDPVRKSFALAGKNGVLSKSNFPLDVGRETTENEFIPLVHYPTILVMPMLYPAPTYSNRSIDADGFFNFRLHNINADALLLKRYEIDKFSTQAIDMVRFTQLIAKIGYAYGVHHFGLHLCEGTLASFICKSFPPATPATGHFANVGCLWDPIDTPTTNLHELEAGRMIWKNKTVEAVRVRLFASCGMPSYYVTM